MNDDLKKKALNVVSDEIKLAAAAKANEPGASGQKAKDHAALSGTAAKLDRAVGRR